MPAPLICVKSLSSIICIDPLNADAPDPTMNAAQLRAFHAVATEGSFTAAALRLGVTQPTISSQVKALEDAYGVRLFERLGRGVAPTELGRALHDITQRLYTLEEEARELLDDAQELRAGHLKVGADGPHHIIPLLAAFTSRFPELEVSLDMGNAADVLRAVRDSRIDVAVLAEPDDDPRLHTLRLRTSALVLFVPVDHAWAGRETISLAAVGDQRMILREAASATRRIFEHALQRAGVKPQSVMQIESREAVREAVAAGLGIGVVSRAEFDPDARLHALEVEDATLEITEHVVCLQERRRLRVVRAFLEVVADALESS